MSLSISETLAMNRLRDQLTELEGRLAALEARPLPLLVPDAGPAEAKRAPARPRRDGA